MERLTEKEMSEIQGGARRCVFWVVSPFYGRVCIKYLW